MIPSKQRSGWQYWEVAELLREGMLEIGDGYRAKNSEMGTSGLPFARAGNVNNGFHFDDADILSKESVRIAGDKLSRPGDITFTSKGTFGRFAFVRQDTPPFVYSPQLCYWRVKRDGVVERRFLYYWMQGADCMNQLNEVKGLTDMADYVNLTNQRKMWLSAPPFPAQRRIADILSAYDELIENNQRRIKILEEMARSLYREWFVLFRFPGHDKVKMVPSPLGRIPQGWEVKRLLDVANVIYGFAFASNKFNTTGIGTPVIRIRDIPTGATETWTDEVTDPKYEIRNGDILVGMDGDFHMCIWSSGRACQNQRVAKFTSRGEIGNLHLFLTLEKPIQTLNKSIVGTTVAHLGDMHIKTIEIIWPPSKLLSRTRALLEPMSEQIINLKRQATNLRRTRDLLLPRLLSGHIEI